MSRTIISTPRVELGNDEQLSTTLAALNITERSRPIVMLNAGPNRGFNGSAAVQMTGDLQRLYGCRAKLAVRVDDEELWPLKITGLRRQKIGKRIQSTLEVTREQVLGELPQLQDLERAVQSREAELHVVLQPQCTSYIEEYWAIDPPHETLAMPDDPTHLITMASCTPLQNRMRLAAVDALRHHQPESLEHVSIMRHCAEVNRRDEQRSYRFTQVARFVLGERRYRDLCMGEGFLGRLYKLIQSAKVERAKSK